MERRGAGHRGGALLPWEPMLGAHSWGKSTEESACSSVRSRGGGGFQEVHGAVRHRTHKNEQALVWVRDQDGHQERLE